MPRVRWLTLAEVTGLTGLSARRMRDWQAKGVFSVGDQGADSRASIRHVYRFDEALALYLLAKLRSHGVRLADLRDVHRWLRARDPASWSGLSLCLAGRRVDLGKPCPARPVQGSAPSCLTIRLGDLADELDARIAEMRTRRPEDIGRVTRDRRIRSNEWIMAGTRIPTWSIWQMHQEGYDLGAILQQFPDLTPRDVESALAHEARLRQQGVA
jgi:uncharacterized protein (DUF433 family)